MAEITQHAKGKLIRQVNDRRDLLIESDRAVVIKDKYPKAQYHFIVLAKEEIKKVTELTREHLPLLDHMFDLANEIIEKQEHLPSSDFLIGFKMDGFMDGLLLHVISNDFYSYSLRKQSHWNIFNTELFLSFRAAYALLRIHGSIEAMSKERALELREAKPLKCNQCDFSAETLVPLKLHLATHWTKREKYRQLNVQVEKVQRLLNEVKENTTKLKAEDPVDLDNAIETLTLNNNSNNDEKKAEQQPQQHNKSGQQANKFKQNFKPGFAGNGPHLRHQQPGFILPNPAPGAAQQWSFPPQPGYNPFKYGPHFQLPYGSHFPFNFNHNQGLFGQPFPQHGDAQQRQAAPNAYLAAPMQRNANWKPHNQQQKGQQGQKQPQGQQQSSGPQQPSDQQKAPGSHFQSGKPANSKYKWQGQQQSSGPKKSQGPQQSSGPKQPQGPQQPSDQQKAPGSHFQSGKPANSKNKWYPKKKNNSQQKNLPK